VNLAAIDWQRPWLNHLREQGLQIANSADWIQAANQVIHVRDLYNANAKPLLFLPQAYISDLSGYEEHIYKTGEIPTRDNLHDFFNALIWLRFPRIKQTLNHLQYKEIARINSLTNVETERGRQRDAATLFDENCAIVVSSDPCFEEGLKKRLWKKTLLRDPCNFNQNCEVILFGHALIEKLTKPYKAITAHVWNLSVDSDWFTQAVDERMASLDQRLAEDLVQGFASSDFSHLPVLGVPGWWHDQTDEFYADTSVFRPLRPI
jgi:hypothetical protein